jgi:hypothetical protein
MAFFEDFKGSDTILIHGDADGLRQLSSVLCEIGYGRSGLIQLDQLPFVTSLRSTSLQARAAPGRCSLSRIKGPVSNAFSLVQSPADWVADAAVILGVADTGNCHNWIPGHETGGLTIMVSNGEFYTDEWFDRHAPVGG